jgi:2-polyprenyl-6-methoxyphenol hydroxylase-like FAD-dependent oxidoreductase
MVTSKTGTVRHPERGVIMETADVVVIGAGPTGLLLAGDLAEHDVSSLVLERRHNQSNLTRAFAVHSRTLEVLDMRGLADELVDGGRPVAALDLFGGHAIDLTGLPSRFPFSVVVPQSRTEELLQARAEAAGAVILTGHAVEAIEQQSDGSVVVRVTDGEGRTKQVAARFVVGCDGVHSVTRTEMGIPFPGRSVVDSVMLADVRLTRPPAAALTVDAAARGFAFIAPFGDGWYRVIAWDREDQRPDHSPVSLEEVSSITAAVLGDDFGMHGPRWLSRFHCDERQAPCYRSGGVFLAGDAAHVHSPAGGQGMNAGLQDAANLSWKLALVTAGAATEELLDTYQQERHPVGERIIKTSNALLRAAMLRSGAARTGRNLAATIATRLPFLAQSLALDVSAIDVDYATDPVRPAVGRRAPDVPVNSVPGGYGRLYEALRTRRFVLQLPATAPRPSPPDRFVTPVRAMSLTEPAKLIRPDGYVAWAGKRGDQQLRTGDLDATLRRLHITAGVSAAVPLC